MTTAIVSKSPSADVAAQVINALFPELATQQGGGYGDAGGRLFSPYEAGVYVGLDDDILQKMRNRQSGLYRANQLRRTAPSQSPFYHNDPISNGPFGLIERTLNWRIGF